MWDPRDITGQTTTTAQTGNRIYDNPDVKLYHTRVHSSVRVWRSIQLLLHTRNNAEGGGLLARDSQCDGSFRHFTVRQSRHTSGTPSVIGGTRWAATDRHGEGAMITHTQYLHVRVFSATVLPQTHVADAMPRIRQKQPSQTPSPTCRGKRQPSGSRRFRHATRDVILRCSSYRPNSCSRSSMRVAHSSKVFAHLVSCLPTNAGLRNGRFQFSSKDKLCEELEESNILRDLLRDRLSRCD